MDFKKIYKIGNLMPFISVKKADEKLNFVLFPYNSKQILATSAIVFLVFAFLSFISQAFSQFFVYAFFYFGLIFAIFLYIYPVNIYYTHQIIDYSEEMLKAVMKLSTYISMNTGLEYAIIETNKDLRGILRLQFNDIIMKLKTKERTTLGDAISDYVDVWNKINPEFVKSLKLLQTAIMSPKEERETIIGEVIETIILNYHNSGKRFAETLASKAKVLIALGVLLPIISLMLLPLVSIFLPNIVTPSLIAFIYNILFPTTLLLMALDFSAARVQVNTIRLEDSPYYTKMPLWLYFMSAAIIIVFSIPSILHLNNIDMTLVETASREYALSSILVVGTAPLGIVIAIFFFTRYYIKRYEKLWNEVYQTELDFPYLLQVFSTYLNLNRSVESIIPEIINDYEVHGYKDHPIVAIFRRLKHELHTSKKTIRELTIKILPRICPSLKVSQTLTQLVGFTEISQRSAGRAAKMVRQQSLSIHKLDDYIKSLLSDTVGLINITTTMLAPLLSAVAVIMSLAIVMSLTFISQQLESISASMGAKATKLSLVDITAIIPPTVIEIIVSIYLIEMVLVLSIFMSNIKIGNDKYLLMKTINSNILIGFMIYAIILVMGFMLFRVKVFSGVIG